ncbi:MAG TPA: plastocyanin/azurin family copper-binding protein [Solirubrobacterales bacterium]
MDGNFFFVIGIVLVIAAVGLAFFGIRENERFPASRAVLVGVTALFAAAVVTTMAFAVVKSVDEQDKRNAELAKEEEQAQPESNAPSGQAQGGGAAETLDVSSPADGALVFQPDGLTAKPGNLTVDYDNPSQVPHSIAIATANGNVLGETQPSTNGVETLQIPDLTPGKYVFYCTVPGHREAGMEGNLTVTGGPTP